MTFVELAHAAQDAGVVLSDNPSREEIIRRLNRLEV